MNSATTQGICLFKNLRVQVLNTSRAVTTVIDGLDLGRTCVHSPAWKAHLFLCSPMMVGNNTDQIRFTPYQKGYKQPYLHPLGTTDFSHKKG